MCKCTPNLRSPYCGKPGCEWPPMTPGQMIPIDFPSLRDELAKTALLGILAGFRWEPGRVFDPDELASDAYAVADAMLKQRAQPSDRLRVPPHGPNEVGR